MALTLTNTIDDTADTLEVTGTVPADCVPGSYRFRFAGDDEVMALVGFGRVKPSHGFPVDPNVWIVTRGDLETTPESHTSGAQVEAVVDAYVASANANDPDPIPLGVGDTPTLAQVLAQGNDTGGIGIVSVTTGSDEADASTTATSVDGNATASSAATSNANAQVTATALSHGAGNADVTAFAQNDTDTGDAYANKVAISGPNGGAAFGTTYVQASASGTADASTTATSVDGNATATTTATASGTGSADATATATAGGGSASIGPVADAETALVKVTGLPDSDPGVPGALYQVDGVVMVSL